MYCDESGSYQNLCTRESNGEEKIDIGSRGCKQPSEVLEVLLGVKEISPPQAGERPTPTIDVVPKTNALSIYILNTKKNVNELQNAAAVWDWMSVIRDEGDCTE